MATQDSEYTPLAQDDVEKEFDSLRHPREDGYRDYRSVSSLAVWTIVLVVLAVAINVACMATTWSRINKVYSALHGMLDFQDTRDLWRPNTDSYYGD
ncbi:uncharacterized protein PHACADRAFT_254138, partial [Phanerochaete carnosa HHB-10118-sp]